MFDSWYELVNKYTLDTPKTFLTKSLLSIKHVLLNMVFEFNDLTLKFQTFIAPFFGPFRRCFRATDATDATVRLASL